MQKHTVMIIGLGELGGLMLEFLARVPNLGCRIVAADINEDEGVRKRNSAIFGASYWGHYPHIDFIGVDLSDINATAATLRTVRPDILLNATTLASWWVLHVLPAEIVQKLYVLGAGGGAWTALHLALTHKLMLAVRESGLRPIVVNASYPDVVNPTLAKVGLAPTVGIGNLDLAIPPIRLAAAVRFGVPMRNVDAYLVAHHFHAYNITRHGDTKGVPFYLKLIVGGADVTRELDLKSFLHDVAGVARRPSGSAGATFITAGAASKNLLALLNDTGELTHSPGPRGLPGGYPVRLSQQGVEVVLPHDITLEEAVRLNEAGQRAEGVERIEEDGTVVLTDAARAVLKEVVGADCARIPLDDCWQVARELGAKLRELGQRFGLSLRVH